MKRVFDTCMALLGLIVVSPVLLIAAAGIKFTSTGPILYRARRAGLRGKEFTLYKFRTMRVETSGTSASAITAYKDSRIFPFGTWLRQTKVDELPQLINVIRGEMAIVGPRPEDPSIVRRYYTAADLQTLEVRPGLTSPGTLYYYTQCEPVLIGDDVTRVYGEQLLPRKLAIDREYVRNARFFDDLRTILQTVVVLAGRVLRCREVRERPAT